MNRRWKFLAENDAPVGYLLASGDMVHSACEAVDFIGTDHEADAEAQRRADLYEDKIGGIIARITYESQGKVS